MSWSEAASSPVDVLVLGAGLAGLRAGIAALRERPEAKVLCLSLGQGACGSSFANRNNALGMQVLADSGEQEAYLARAREIASPGVVDPDLIRLMAAESLPRLREMLEWGVGFRGAENGLEDVLRQRVTGCFLPEQPSAAVFEGLGRAHAAFARRFSELGGAMREKTLVLGLMQAPNRPGPNVRGAYVLFEGDDVPTVLPARSVVLALGGPAPLYGTHVAGPAVSGWSYALLERAGAVVRNAGFLQFLWHSVQPRRFLSLPAMAQEGWLVRGHAAKGGGEPLDIPSGLRSHAALRGTHYPFAYDREDAALDRFLLRQRNDVGLTQVRPPGEGVWRDVAPLAHAGNGGAWIDPQGRTEVESLYACGESATGMHGANRIGGGMVLATQVFGARAGACAAREAMERPYTARRDMVLCGSRGHPREQGGSAQDSEARAWLKGALFQHAVCGGDPETLPGFLEALEQGLASAMPLRERLCWETAAIIARQLVSPETARRSGLSGSRFVSKGAEGA